MTSILTWLCLSKKDKLFVARSSPPNRQYNKKTVAF